MKKTGWEEEEEEGRGWATEPILLLGKRSGLHTDAAREMTACFMIV